MDPKTFAITKYPTGWEETFGKSERELESVANRITRINANHPGFYPSPKLVFRAFDLVPLDKLKVVILGQDPHTKISTRTGEPAARGLSYSVHKDDVIPKAVSSIHTVLKSTVTGFTVPNHGNLTQWCKQGVMLLNYSLTYCPDSPRRHQMIWQGLFKHVIKSIRYQRPNTVFVLWGSKARLLKDDLGKLPYVLGPHPAAQDGGFLKGDYFNEVNQKLLASGQGPIDWSLRDRE